MRSGPLLACALLAACFSKPPNNTGGGDDAGVDDAPIDGPPIAPGSAARIATGARHACRITPDTNVVCWGDHNKGQLGTRTIPFGAEWTGIPDSAMPSKKTGWTSIAAGLQHTCGVNSGAVYCWGENYHNQSAPLNIDDLVPPSPVPLPKAAERVFAGGFTTCAITVDHEAYCWGDTDFEVIRTFNDHIAADHPTAPIRLAPTTTFSEIAIASDHACALDDTGVMHCWGEGDQLQLGKSTPADLQFGQIAAIESTARFTSVDTSREATCATTTIDNRLICFGSSNLGHLGEGLPAGGNTFQVINATVPWSAVTLGANHVCAVTNGAVHCYGKTDRGGLGTGRFAERRTLDVNNSVATMMSVGQIAANEAHTCALSTDGNTMKCWGENTKGHLGNRHASRKIVPTSVTLPGAVAQLVAGDYHTCALVGAASPYDAYCWGLNHDEQIGTGSGLAKHALPERASTSTFLQLTAGEEHTCGIKSATEVECWGENEDGQLGNSLQGQRRVTVSGTAWTDISAGSRMTCGVDNGNLRCWGSLFGGAASAPTTIPRIGANPWLWFSVGSGFGVGVFLNAGAFRLAGYARTIDRRCAAGLHDGDDLGTSEEILSGFTFGATRPRVSTAQSSGEHTCVHHSAGGTPSVTCFGTPTLTQVGTGGAFVCGVQDGLSHEVTGTWSAPPTSPLVYGMFATGDHTCALDDGKILKCWGGNSDHELGPNANIGSTPESVFSTFVWDSIAGGSHHTCGILAADDLVYCWGANEYGQAGDGSSWEAVPVVAGVPPPP